MFVSPYDTTICRNIANRQRIEKELVEATISNSLLHPAESHKVLAVGPDRPDITPFSHPMIVNVPSRGEFVIFDMRGLTTINSMNGLPAETSDYIYQKTRAVLISAIWKDGNSTDVLELGDLVIKTYGRFISGTLTRRLNLDPILSSTIGVMAQFFFISICNKDLDLDDESAMLRVAKRISRTTGVPIENVLEICRSCGQMTHLDHLCRALYLGTGSKRLEKLSPAILYTMLGGMWMGSNPVEQSAVALEHPPTFAAMLYVAANNRSFKNTVLGNLALQINGRDDLIKDFTMAVNRIIRG